VTGQLKAPRSGKTKACAARPAAERVHAPHGRAEPGRLSLVELDSAVGCHGCVTSLHWANDSPCAVVRRGLTAGCGWPVRTLTECLVRAPVVVVRATKCGACGLTFAKPGVA
jgi:hypothetical protein